MFDGTVLLYGIVSAMMIGKDKTFGRYDFTGTASAENDDGIFHRCTVGIVNIIDVDKQTGFFSCSLFCCLRKGRSHIPSSATAGETAMVAASRAAKDFLTS